MVDGHQNVTDNSRDLCKRRFNQIRDLTSIRALTKVKEEMFQMLYQRTLKIKCFSLDILRVGFHTQPMILTYVCLIKKKHNKLIQIVNIELEKTG